MVSPYLNLPIRSLSNVEDLQKCQRLIKLLGELEHEMDNAAYDCGSELNDAIAFARGRVREAAEHLNLQERELSIDAACDASDEIGRERSAYQHAAGY